MSYNKRTIKSLIHHNEGKELKDRRSVSVLYRKMSGRTVRRKIDPLKLKSTLSGNDILIGYDHKRKAIRSFKPKMFKEMKKIAFWGGFEKQAKKDSDSHTGRNVAIGAATLLGAAVLGKKFKTYSRGKDNMFSKAFGHHSAKPKRHQSYYQNAIDDGSGMGRYDHISKAQQNKVPRKKAGEIVRSRPKNLFDNRPAITRKRKNRHETWLTTSKPSVNPSKDLRRTPFTTRIIWDRKPSKKTVDKETNNLKDIKLKGVGDK